MSLILSQLLPRGGTDLMGPQHRASASADLLKAPFVSEANCCASAPVGAPTNGAFNCRMNPASPLQLPRTAAPIPVAGVCVAAIDGACLEFQRRESRYLECARDSD